MCSDFRATAEWIYNRMQIVWAQDEQWLKIRVLRRAPAIHKCAAFDHEQADSDLQAGVCCQSAGPSRRASIDAV